MAVATKVPKYDVTDLEPAGDQPEAIAQAKDPIAMAEAFRLGVEAGRTAFRAGRTTRKELAEASSPAEGVARPV